MAFNWLLDGTCLCELHMCFCSQAYHWQDVQQPHQVVRVCYVQCVDALYHNVAISTNTWELTRWQQEKTELWTTQNLPRYLSFHWIMFRCIMPLEVVAWGPLPAITLIPHSQQKREAQWPVMQWSLCMGLLPCLRSCTRHHATANCECIKW